MFTFTPQLVSSSSRVVVNVCHSIYSIRMSKYHPRKRQVGYKSTCKQNSGPVAVSVILCSVKFEYERFCFLLYLLSRYIRYKYTHTKKMINLFWKLIHLMLYLLTIYNHIRTHLNSCWLVFYFENSFIDFWSGPESRKKSV